MLDIPQTDRTAPTSAAAIRAGRIVRGGWRYRVNVAARTLAATFGAYMVAALFAAATARLTPLPRLDAILPATMLAFVVFVPAVLWSFLARSAFRAWSGIVLAAVPLALAAWLAGPPA